MSKTSLINVDKTLNMDINELEKIQKNQHNIIHMLGYLRYEQKKNIKIKKIKILEDNCESVMTYDGIRNTSDIGFRVLILENINHW